MMKSKTYILLFLGLFIQMGVSGLYAQEKEERLEKRNLRQSVDLTYEANSELEDEDFTEAEATYRKAIARSEKNAVARYNLGNAYYNNNSMGEAFMRFKEAGETAGSKAEKHKAFHNMGNVFMKNKEYQKAVEAYKEALRNDPADEETRYNLALAKEMLEKEQQENEQNKDDQEKNQDNQDNKDQQQQQQDQQNQDQEGGEQDQQEDKGNPDQDGDQKEDQQQQGEGDQQQKEKKPQEGEGQPQQPRQSQLSPQQIKNILEAMNNEEKKVQEKLNAKKVKGIPVKTEKDW